MIFLKQFQSYRDDIVHGLMEKGDGNRIEDIVAAVQKAGFEQAGPGNFVFAQQVHSKNVHFCSQKDFGQTILRTDGLVSDIPGQVLAVKTADCLPILFYDPLKKQAAVVHAGKKGLLNGILKETLRALEANPSFLLVGIGPHIRKCCYYLRSRKEIEKIACSNLKIYLKRKKGKFYFDLSQIAIDQLISLGVKKKNIEDVKICTYCDPKQRFFSARRLESLGQAPRCFFSFISLIN